MIDLGETGTKYQNKGSVRASLNSWITKNKFTREKTITNVDNAIST